MRSTIVALVLIWVVPADAGHTVQECRLNQDACRIAGRVRGLQGNDHVIVKAVGPQTHRATTRSEGRWSISAMAAGAYTVTPISARYSFEPAEIAIVLGDRPLEHLDFRATPTTRAASSVAPCDTDRRLRLRGGSGVQTEPRVVTSRPSQVHHKYIYKRKLPVDTRGRETNHRCHCHG